MEEEAEARTVDSTADTAKLGVAAPDATTPLAASCDHPDPDGECDDSIPLHTFEGDGDPADEYKGFQFSTNKAGVWNSARFDKNWKWLSKHGPTAPTAKGATALLPSIGVWTDTYEVKHSVDARLTMTDYTEYAALNGNSNGGLNLFLRGSVPDNGWQHFDLRVDFLYSGTDELVPTEFKGLTGMQDIDYGWSQEYVEFLDGVDGFWARRDAHLRRWGLNGFTGTDEHGEQESNTTPHDLQHTITVAFSGPTIELRYSKYRGERGAAFDVPILKAAQVYNVEGRAVDQNGEKIKSPWVLAGMGTLRTGAAYDATGMAPVIPGYRLVGLADASDPVKGTIQDANRKITWKYAKLAAALPATGASAQPTSQATRAVLGSGLLLAGASMLLAVRRRTTGRRAG